MARKLRYEQEGGLYHVINRGNYRQPVFGSVGAAQAFETALWETVKRYGWRVHGYVLMTNHYHLALETPQPNLVIGMHRLQSAFSTRFNRFRSERGHLFQGRYQALPVENATALSAVVDYIHLNPFRAKMVEAAQLTGFRWSSLRRFVRGDRPEGLVGDLVMGRWGLADDAAGWSAYLTRLQELATDEAEQAKLGFDEMCKGWAIGTDGWRQSMAKALNQRSLAGLAQEEARGVRADGWYAVLDETLRECAKTRADLTPLEPRQRDEPWRFKIALRLRRSGATNPWIAQVLGYPSANSLRVRLTRS
jgi:REP element-mobilizing transposase RayT